MEGVTPGPWEASKDTGYAASYVLGPDGVIVADIMASADAEFVAEARELFPKLVSAAKIFKGFWQETHDRVEDALTLHREHQCGTDICEVYWTESLDCNLNGECQECGEDFPCDTRTILTGAEE